MSGPRCELKYNPFSQTVGDSTDFTIEYTIFDVEEINAATALLKATAPTRAGPLYPHNFAVTPVATGVWDGRAIYATAKPSGEPTFSIEIGVANQKITQSLQTIGRYSTSGPVADYRGAIGVTKDSVEGCDAVFANMTWNERHILPNSRISNGYIQQVFTCMARMNDSQFRIFNRGEALFIGCTLAQSKEVDGWEGNFKWIGSPNATNLTVGPMTVSEKLGHDYLWVRYKDATSANSLVRIPQYAFVERIYQFASMGDLRLDDPT